MNNELFLITGGGTGAKVAEAFVHLCAAGLGPKRAHVLLIDTDTRNGNLERTVETFKAYGRLQAWPWDVQVGDDWVHLFATELVLHIIATPIDAVSSGGIQTMVADDPEMQQVLKLLYDPDEQKARCEDGFQARPNLGCLLLASHLNKRLPENTADFLAKMKAAVQSNERVPVIVTASVFGGTGASLLPIIRGCVETALKNRGTRDLEHLRWSAIKLTPYYQPTDRIENVDPNRYLLDTALALRYYSEVYETPAYYAMCLVGSDDPSRNRVRPSVGRSGQANPPFFEEFLAALLVQKFAQPIADKRRPVHLFEVDDTIDALGWDLLARLRNGAQTSQGTNRLLEQFGYLLHTAAFYMRIGTESPELSQGLAALLRNADPRSLTRHPWYERIIDPWAAKASGKYKRARGILRGRKARVEVLMNPADMGKHAVGSPDAEGMAAHVAEYFGRLLLWSETALKNTEAVSLLDHDPDHYGGLYNVMSEIEPDNVNRRKTEGAAEHLDAQQDNALVRMLRIAIAAMMREHNREGVKGKEGHGDFRLVDEQGRIAFSILPADVRRTLDIYHKKVYEEYTRTLM